MLKSYKWMVGPKSPGDLILRAPAVLIIVGLLMICATVLYEVTCSQNANVNGETFEVVPYIFIFYWP